jgi:hypothetical protein
MLPPNSNEIDLIHARSFSSWRTPEPRSFNAHLVSSGAAELEAAGWTTTVSDLYAMGVDPCERPEFFPDRVQPDRFDIQAEQRIRQWHVAEGSSRRAGAHGSRRSVSLPVPTVVASSARDLKGLV